jgi:hypothetical protein
MTGDPGRSKWHQVEAAVAKRLTDGTPTPGVIYPIGSNSLPAQLAGLPGAVSFFASSYIQPALVARDMTAGAEVVVVRHQGDTAKAYNWMSSALARIDPPLLARSDPAGRAVKGTGARGRQPG